MHKIITLGSDMIFDIRKNRRFASMYFRPEIYYQVLESDIENCECEDISHNGQVVSLVRS